MKAAENQINHTKDRLWSFDANLICIVSNNLIRDDFKTAFGINLEPGVHVLEGVPEPIYTMWKERYELALEGKPVEFQDAFEIDGVPAYVEVSMFPIIEKGEILGAACTSRDIPIRKVAELQLLEKEAFLTAQIENTTDSIWSIGSDFRVLTVNSVMAHNFEMAFQHRLMVGDMIMDVIPDPLAPLWLERYQRALKGVQYSVIDHFDFENIPQYVEVSFNPIKVGEEIVGVACFSKNITKIKLSEIELQQSLEVKNKFFSIVAHDLRGPMGNIRQLVRMLSDDTIPEEQKDRMMKFLSEATESASALLDNLLEWGLIQRNMVKLESVDLDVKVLVEESIKAHLFSAKSKNIKTTVEIGDNEAICSDKRTLSQILYNLYSNAIKFTNNEGEVIISTIKQDDGVEFIVKDNGCGMDKETSDHLFNSDGKLNGIAPRPKIISCCCNGLFHTRLS